MKLRTNDSAIMDVVQKLGFTAVQEHQINCVRLFLGVMYFSEICSIDGTNLRYGITTGDNNHEEYNASLKKAIQHHHNTKLDIMDTSNHLYHIRWYSIKGTTRRLDNKSQQIREMECIPT
jgi:hypothetical protein